MQKFTNVPKTRIDEVLGKSTYLIIGINDYVGNKVDLYNGIVYAIPKKDLYKNADLTALLFGRINSLGVFKGCSTVAKVLTRQFKRLYMIDRFKVIDLETFQINNGFSNYGDGAEYFFPYFTHCTEYRDKELKQDVIYNHHFSQVKFSLTNEKRKGSFSTTNCK